MKFANLETFKKLKEVGLPQDGIQFSYFKNRISDGVFIDMNGES